MPIREYKTCNHIFCLANKTANFCRSNSGIKSVNSSNILDKLSFTCSSLVVITAMLSVFKVTASVSFSNWSSNSDILALLWSTLLTISTYNGETVENVVGCWVIDDVDGACVTEALEVVLVFSIDVESGMERVVCDVVDGKVAIWIGSVMTTGEHVDGESSVAIKGFGVSIITGHSQSFKSLGDVELLSENVPILAWIKLTEDSTSSGKLGKLEIIAGFSLWTVAWVVVATKVVTLFLLSRNFWTRRDINESCLFLAIFRSTPIGCQLIDFNFQSEILRYLIFTDFNFWQKNQPWTEFSLGGTLEKKASNIKTVFTNKNKKVFHILLANILPNFYDLIWHCRCRIENQNLYDDKIKRKNAL